MTEDFSEDKLDAKQFMQAIETLQRAVNQNQRSKVHRSSDVQREYLRLKDSLAKVKLPYEVKLFDNKTGIKRDEQQHLTTINKLEKYTGAYLK